MFTKCLHNRPDGYNYIKRPSLPPLRHHACAEDSSNPNKKDGDQTCKKSGCFYTRKPCLNYSFQNDDTQGFQNILAMSFSSAVKCYVKKHYLWCHEKVLNPNTGISHF